MRREARLKVQARSTHPLFTMEAPEPVRTGTDPQGQGGGGTERISKSWALRVLRMVSTSTRQRLCLWQEPIPGNTSEQGAAQSLALVRSHWSIEDDVFNPLDCQWEKDCTFRHTSMESALALSFV